MTERRDMHEGGLDPGALAALRALRDADDMPADAHARVWDRLAAATAEEPEETGPEAHSPWALSSRTWIVLTLAAAALALLLGRTGVLDQRVAAREDQAARHDTAPEPTGGEARHDRAVRAAAPTEPAPPAAPVPEETPGQVAKDMPDPPAADDRPPRATRGSHEPTARPNPPTPTDEPGSLAAEAESLARAQAALQRGEPDDALTVLTAHARRFPRGALREEHDALRAIALCAADRAREGRGEAQAFLRAHPTSPLAERVRTACDAP